MSSHQSSPFATLANLSLQSGKFPSCYKKAQMLPLLKKPGLESSSPANYRPISNLTTVSKVLERLVLTRLRPHLLGCANFSQFQSTYRQFTTARWVTSSQTMVFTTNYHQYADDTQLHLAMSVDNTGA